MATPVIKKFNSTTWQFTSASGPVPSTPSELFAAAAAELAKPGIMLQLVAADVARDNTGKYTLTLYFSQIS